MEELPNKEAAFREHGDSHARKILLLTPLRERRYESVATRVKHQRRVSYQALRFPRPPVADHPPRGMAAAPYVTEGGE